MGLLDWLTDGLGSGAGLSEAGIGAGSSMEMPQPVQPTPPTPPAPPVAPTPPLEPATPDIGAGTPAGPAASPAPVPMPVPRPPGADSGPAAPPATPASGAGMPPGPPTSITPPAPPMSAPADTSAMPGPNAGNSPASGFLGRALGLDANRERSLKGSLAAGFKAAGNSAGKSPFQALASGAGESLEGGQKASDTGYDQRLKALQLAVTAQAAGDKAAYNKNYAEYLKGKLAADEKGATPGGKKGAWNKPDSQKFIDAQNAMAKDPDIRASQKILEGAIRDGDPKAIAAAQASHQALVQQKQGLYLTGVGLSAAQIQANQQNPPGTPANPHVVMNKQDFDTYVKPGQAYKNPADGKIYIRNPDKGADTKADEPASAAAAPTAPAPPGPMPGTTAAKEEDED
jgi:hypothetical protein